MRKRSLTTPSRAIPAITLVCAASLIASCGQQAEDPSPEDEGGPDGTAQVSVGEDCEDVVLRVAHAVAPGSPVDQATERLAELAAEKSGGTLEVQVFPAGQLGNEQEYLEGLASGSLEMAAIVGNAYGTVAPETNVLALPYAFRDYEHLKAAMDGEPGQQIVETVEEQAQVRILDPSWYYGTRHLTANQPIQTPDELQGVKLRITPVPVVEQSWAQMGATPSPVDFSELYTALQSGVVDAQENPLPTIATSNLNEVQDYLMLTGHTVANLMVAINPELHDSLCEEQRAALDGATQEAGDFIDETVLQAEEDLRGELTSEGGMELVEPDVEAFRARLEGFPESFQDGVMLDLYQAIQAAE
ncbi:TRAP transporter substrate-binding protein [Ornithinicoccus halotolerans]|uniref:TRAP transporter substrate-binding protein n=1 Tax=Ornithinicoccus halotolerans TaxID=1748220 RepID=UPI001298160E|nr:TRAP transporter substrate-binding protein [Ornithinicoccus halotolerans]